LRNYDSWNAIYMRIEMIGFSVMNKSVDKEVESAVDGTAHHRQIPVEVVESYLTA
jgi:hypothetical protein